MTLKVVSLSKEPRETAKTVKFSDVVKGAALKKHDDQKASDKPIDEIVMEIKQSSWKGKNLCYLLLLESGQEKWIKWSNCNSITNRGAPTPAGYITFEIRGDSIGLFGLMN